MGLNRGCAAAGTGCILGAATRRSGATARSRNNVGGRFPRLPEGFEREGMHCSVAALAQGTTLCGTAPCTAPLLVRTHHLFRLITGSRKDRNGKKWQKQDARRCSAFLRQACTTWHTRNGEILAIRKCWYAC